MRLAHPIFAYPLAVREALLLPFASCLQTSISLCSQRRAAASSNGPEYDSGLEAKYEEARKWYSSFSASTIPEKIAVTNFTRSSGPGGQKVNKYEFKRLAHMTLADEPERTSSKANIEWPMDSLQKYIPQILIPALRDSRFYARKSDCIHISSDSQREQNRNKEDCHRKLFEEVKEIYSNIIPGVTSSEQKDKVDKL